MNTKRKLGLMARTVVLLLVCALFAVVFSANAYADKKCDVALAKYEKQMHDFMMANRAYAKALTNIVKALKKSAKKYKVDKAYIKQIASDQSVSKKEARKMDKMIQKVRMVSQKLGEVTGATQKMGDELETLDKAYRNYDNNCDAER